MQAQFTPGPWEVKDGQEVMAENGRRVVARCHAGHAPERTANARLIAAAPTLAEALADIRRTCYFAPSTPREELADRLVEIGEAVNVVLARATGGA
jgi:hypothetical protein